MTMRRSISNTETAITKPCHSLACDLCGGSEDGCTPLPLTKAHEACNNLKTPAGRDSREARRLAIIEAQERLMQGI
jgi:hypothetical protein